MPTPIQPPVWLTTNANMHFVVNFIWSTLYLGGCFDQAIKTFSIYRG